MMHMKLSFSAAFSFTGTMCIDCSEYINMINKKASKQTNEQTELFAPKYQENTLKLLKATNDIQYGCKFFLN